jgi:hypothetical protein
MRRVYFPCLVMILLMWAASILLYRCGATSIGFDGGSIEIDRRFDHELWGVTDDAALEPVMGYLSLVKIERAPFPMCPFCGTYQKNGVLVNGVTHVKDGVFFRAPREMEKGAPPQALYLICNTATGEVTSMPDGATIEQQTALLASKSLVADDAHRITPSVLAKTRPLSVVHESCKVINFAFIIAFVGWLLVGGVLWLRRPAVSTS